MLDHGIKLKTFHRILVHSENQITITSSCLLLFSFHVYKYSHVSLLNINGKQRMIFHN